MKDSLDTAQCAGTMCQAAEHTEPRGCPAGVGSTEHPPFPAQRPACPGTPCLLQSRETSAVCSDTVSLLPWLQLQSYWKGRTPHRGQAAGSPSALLAPTLHLSLLGTWDSSGEKKMLQRCRGLHCPAQGWPVPGDARKTGERKEERPMLPNAFLQWGPVHSQTSPCGQPRALPRAGLGPSQKYTQDHSPHGHAGRQGTVSVGNTIMLLPQTMLS